MTPDEALTVIVKTTGMSREELSDFLACSPADQALLARSYADQDWAKQGSAWTTVIAAFEVLATVAGVVSGVAGAASAVVALRSI